MTAHADVVITTSTGAGADTHIRGGAYVTENNGSATGIQATLETSSADFRRAIYLKFDVSGLASSTIQDAAGASLNLFNAFSSPTGTLNARIYGLNDSAGLDGWGEGTITALNAPAVTNAANLTLDATKLTNLGTLATNQGDSSTGSDEAYPTFSNEALLNFLQTDSDGQVTFIIRLDSYADGGSGNLGVRTKEYASGSLAPSLTIMDPPPTYAQSVIYPQDGEAYASGENVFVLSMLKSGETLDRVTFSLNGIAVGEDSESPFEWVFPAGTLPDGSHVLTLTGYVGSNPVETIERTFTVGGLQELGDDFIFAASPRLTDWSTAGYRQGRTEPPLPAGPLFDVTTYGAVANDGANDAVGVQAAIDAAEAAGGGIVFFPPGQFDFWVPPSPGYDDILKVSGSHIILRGSGSGTGGTILKQRNTYTDIPDTSYTRYHLIRIGTGLNYRSTSRPFIADAAKHATSIVLNSNADIARGDFLQLELISSVDEGGNRLPDLMMDLVAPMTKAMIEPGFTNFLKFNPYRFKVEVAGIEDDGQTVHLATPLPRAMTLNFGARARIIGDSLLQECGVEQLAIEGSYKDAAYDHHASWEADYGWCGIGFLGVAHGWVRDLRFTWMNNDVIATKSIHCTIESLQSSGRGHYGVQLIDSTSCLVRDAVFRSERTHVVSVTEGAVANVFTGISNAASSCHYIDFHGASPSIANLFENSTNLRIGSGGAIQNMPHCGQHNTFWNIEAGGPNPVNDMFTYGLYNYTSYTGPYSTADLHQLHPASLLVGIVRPGGSITVDGSSADRDNGWLYVDSVGTKVAPLSIHHLQRRLRDSRLDFARWKHLRGIAANASDSARLPGRSQGILADWATGETPPLAQGLPGGNLRFSFAVRTADVSLLTRLESNTSLSGAWQEVADEAFIIQPADSVDFSFFEIEVTPDAPRNFYRTTFQRTGP